MALLPAMAGGLRPEVLGLKMVLCIELGHLTPEQKRSYLIADKKIAQNNWNDEFLRLELNYLAIHFPLEGTRCNGEPEPP